MEFLEFQWIFQTDYPEVFAVAKASDLRIVGNFQGSITTTLPGFLRLCMKNLLSNNYLKHLISPIETQTNL